MKSEVEKAYIQGFYASLKGVLYITDDPLSKKQDIVDAIHDTLAEMKADGDLDDIDSSVDELVRLVKLAEAEGREDEFFATLDKHFGGK